MAFWTDDFMAKIRTMWLNKLKKVRYLAGSTWYEAQIVSKEISGNTLKVTTATADSVSATITKIQILDDEGEVAGQVTESITKSSTQGVITLWEFPVYEITS